MTSKDNPPSQNISRHTPCLVILSFSLLLSKSSHRLSQTEDQRPKTEDAIGRSKQINIVLADFTQIVTLSVFHTNCNQLGISTRIATNPLTLPKYCRWLSFSSKIATYPWYYPNIAISSLFHLNIDIGPWYYPNIAIARLFLIQNCHQVRIQTEKGSNPEFCTLILKMFPTLDNANNYYQPTPDLTLLLLLKCLLFTELAEICSLWTSQPPGQMWWLSTTIHFTQDP